MVSASYWSEVSTVTHTFEVAKFINYMAFGMLLADNVAYASFDRDLICGVVSGRRACRWPQFPYLLAKIFWYPYFATNFIVLLTPTQVDCQTVMYMNEFFMGLVSTIVLRITSFFHVFLPA